VVDRRRPHPPRTHLRREQQQSEAIGPTRNGNTKRTDRAQPVESLGEGGQQRALALAGGSRR
jgi:hypothetical protein